MKKYSQVSINHNEISVYHGDLTKETAKNQFHRIKIAFPKLPAEFYIILQERLIENGFSDERFKDAVSHVIDTHIYPQPQIAEFITYDKRIKLFTYQEMLAKVDKENIKWDHFKAVPVPGSKLKLWANKMEIEKYHLNL